MSSVFFINSADCLRDGQTSKTKALVRNSASRRPSAAAVVLLPDCREQQRRTLFEGDLRIDVCRGSGCTPASDRISAGSARRRPSSGPGASAARLATTARSFFSSAFSVATAHPQLPLDALQLVGEAARL